MHADNLRVLSSFLIHIHVLYGERPMLRDSYGCLGLIVRIDVLGLSLSPCVICSLD